jgi:hypothetical protein
MTGPARRCARTADFSSEDLHARFRSCPHPLEVGRCALVAHHQQAADVAVLSRGLLGRRGQPDDRLDRWHRFDRPE